MSKFVSLLLAGACFVLSAGTAFADWSITIESVNDGRGDAAVLHGEADEGRWFQLWCRGAERHFAILVNDGQNDDPSGVTADFEFGADTGVSWSSVGDFYRHDTGWLGFSYRNLADFEGIVRDIIYADGNIAASIVTPGGGMADDINVVASAKGSTKAGRKFAERCFGAVPASILPDALPDAAVDSDPPQTPVVTAPTRPAPQQAQPTTPAQPVSGGVWLTADLSGDTSSRYTAEMTAPAENADATLRFACSPTTGLLTLGIFDRRGFAGDGAYEVTTTIDDMTWTLARSAPERRADGTPGVVSSDAQVLSIIDQLSVAKLAIRIELVHAMGARKSYRFSAEGSINPATDMYFRCRP